MLDGIDYYPRKTKKNSKSKIWILGLVVVSIVLYTVVQNFPQPPQEDSGKTLIVISKGERPIITTNSSIIIKTNQTYQPKIDSRVKSDKGLDELIQTFEQQ
jgi:hypothetical protein